MILSSVYKTYLLSALLLVTYSFGSDTVEHSFYPVDVGGVSADQFFTQQHLPDIRLVYRTRPHCKEDCTYPVLVNENSKQLVSYSSGGSINVEAKGRYKDIAYMQYRYSYGCGDKQCSTTVLINNSGDKYRFTLKGNYLDKDTLISRDLALYRVTADGLYKNSIKVSSPPAPLKEARLGNNPDGDIAVVGVSENGEVFVGNEKGWLRSSIQLARHGDRDGVLAVYPENEHSVFALTYKYVNAYNKGLIGIHIDQENSDVHSGWLFNSSARNVGFDPEVYVSQNQVYSSATDSTNNNRVSTVVPITSYANIDHAENYPSTISGFENEEQFTFLVGTRLAYNKWDAKSSVGNDDADYSTMEYEISNLLYWSLYFEGRIGNVRLGLSYLKNRAEQLGALESAATKIFSLYVDYSGLFSDSSSIRVSIEKGEVNGVAKYAVDAQGVASGANAQENSFNATLERISAKVMMERGWYGGIEYAQYTTPSALGFSGRSRQMEYLTIDPALESKDIILLAGYDEISYAKRYETDLSRFYVQGHIGLGVTLFDISSAVQSEVETSTSKKIDDTWSIVIDGELDFGYIWQSRFKELHGFGHAVTLGVKARGSWRGSGQSKDSDSKIPADALRLELERYDIWYGPYVSFNILF